MLESVNNRLFCYPGFRDWLTTMNAEILAVVEFWEKEKGIPKDVLLGAIQESLIETLRLEVVTFCQPPRLLAPRCGFRGLIVRGVFEDLRGKP